MELQRWWCGAGARHVGRARLKRNLTRYYVSYQRRADRGACLLIACLCCGWPCQDRRGGSRGQSFWPPLWRGGSPAGVVVPFSAPQHAAAAADCVWVGGAPNANGPSRRAECEWAVITAAARFAVCGFVVAVQKQYQASHRKIVKGLWSFLCRLSLLQ